MRQGTVARLVELLAHRLLRLAAGAGGDGHLSAGTGPELDAELKKKLLAELGA